MAKKLAIIIVINCFILIINFHNCFDKALTKIFQFCRALVERDCFFDIIEKIVVCSKKTSRGVILGWETLSKSVVFCLNGPQWVSFNHNRLTWKYWFAVDHFHFVSLIRKLISFPLRQCFSSFFGSRHPVRLRKNWRHPCPG